MEFSERIEGIIPKLSDKFGSIELCYVSFACGSLRDDVRLCEVMLSETYQFAISYCVTASRRSE